MNYSDLCSVVADRTGLHLNQIDNVLRKTMDEITHALARGESVRLLRLGTFSPLWQEPKEVGNPKTGERFIMDRRLMAKFKMATALRTYLKNAGEKQMAKKKKGGTNE